MRKNHFLLIASLFLWSGSSPAQTLLEKLSADISDGRLDAFSRIEAACIISGADNPDSLSAMIHWYNAILSDISDKNIIRFERLPSAESLFLYFHTTWLRQYKEKSTTLLDIKNRREFNCVSATVLYNLTCDEFGLNTDAFETPTHVYTIFSNFSEQVMVENTTSMGFNIIKNLSNYSRYLAQYYPEQERLKIGLHRLYAYENSNGRRIDNTELLGLMCYNLAIFNAEQRRYDKAYNYMKIAQCFNEDSRSNRKFELSLYYRWGEALFKQRHFDQAFEVLADAFYRYPDNSDFRNNCHTSFLKALGELWAQKDWANARSIILEMSELNILTDAGLASQQRALTDWMDYLPQANRPEEKSQAMDLYKTFYGESK